MRVGSCALREAKSTRVFDLCVYLEKHAPQVKHELEVLILLQKREVTSETRVLL